MKSKLPTIIGVLILLIGVGAGVFLVSSVKTFRIGANPDIAPQDVRVTNVTGESFTVSWITDKKTVGFVEYGESENLGGKTPQAESSFIHWIEIKSLKPQTKYYFKINSDGTIFDNSGIAWTASTSTPIQNAKALIAGGNVIRPRGRLPAQEVIVYATAPGVAASTLTSDLGYWAIPINANLAGTALIEIFVQGAGQGTALAQIYANAISQTPTIKLGETYDFRSQFPLESSEVPFATIKLPEESEGSGGFKIN